MAQSKNENDLNFCFGCKVDVVHIKRKHFGKRFCDYCYQTHFIKKSCSLCQIEKRIYHLDEACQSCLVATLPCIKCQKIGRPTGKLVTDGFVCKTCSPFFRKPKQCFICKKYKRCTYNSLMDFENKRYCYQCLKSEFYEKCTSCKNQSFIYVCSVDTKNSLCQKCFLKIKECTVCQIRLPAGVRANKCKSCSDRLLFEKRKKIIKTDLQLKTISFVEELTEKLLSLKGYNLASRILVEFSPILRSIDQHYLKFNELPSAEYIVKNIEKYEISHQKSLTKLIYNLRGEDIEHLRTLEKIKKQIAKINESYPEYNVFSSYIDKIKRKNTLINSKRLAITSAAMFIEFMYVLDKNIVDQESLDQFIWLYWGQRASLTGFINHINKVQNLTLMIAPPEHFLFQKKRESTKRLEQQILSLLKDNSKSSQDIILHKVFSYMHNLEFPRILQKINVMKLLKNHDEIRLKGIVFFVGLKRLNFTK